MSGLTIHTYTATEQALLVNAHVIETDDGVFLVDSGLLVSHAQAMSYQPRALGRPVIAAFVTHPHPDHFNGLPYLVDEQVPVRVSTRVANVIAESAQAKREQWQPVYGDDWPDRFRVPDRRMKDAEVVAVGGLRIQVHDLGPAESHADSYLLVEGEAGRAAFIGDIAFAGVHPYTADGHSGAWLEVLARLREELTGLPLYLGHGGPDDVSVLSAQHDYLAGADSVARELAT